MNNGKRPSSNTLEHEERVLRQLLDGCDDDRLTASHFTVPAYRELFSLIADMRAEGEEVNPRTVATYAQFGGIENATSTIESILVEHYNNPDLLDAYVGFLVDAAERRRIESSLAEAMSLIRAKAPIDTIREVIETIRIDGHVGDSIKFYSGPELAKLDTRIEWLIEGVIVKAQPMLTVGPKKALKTNTGIDKALSMATGTPFLGEYKVPLPLRVGFMSAESGKGTIKETAHRVAMAKGFNGVHEIPNALFAFETPMVSAPKDCDKIRRIIETNELQFLTLDPSYLTFGIGDEGKNLFRMGELLSPLSRIIESTGCAIELMHHAKKANGKDGQPLELGDESYSGFSEWARQWLYLSRRTPYDETRPGSHRLWMRYGGSVGHNGLIGLNIEEGRITDQWGRVWKVSTVDASQIIQERKDAAHNQRQAVKDETLERHLQQTREALARFPDGETHRNIAAASKLNKDHCKTALYELVRVGEATECDVIKNKQSYRGFKPVGQWDN